MAAKTRNSLIHAVNAATAPKAAPTEQGGDMMQRRQGRYRQPGYTSLSVFIPADLHTELKIAAVTDRVEMAAIAEAAIRSWLAQRKTSQTR